MKPFARILLAVLAPLVAASCEPANSQAMPDAKQPAPLPDVPQGAEVATLGTGCFWCTEAVFKQIPGVHSATSGYMGGHVENPTYEEVCRETTGHAEVIQVVFDPEKVSYADLLGWFWASHDPTQLNRQGNDVGTQYRSAIFFHSPEQRETAAASKQAAQKEFSKPIVTEITAASTFYPAENYHQDYYFQNKNRNGYCRMVIEPKLQKLKLEH